jgi:hypothetical protein
MPVMIVTENRNGWTEESKKTKESVHWKSEVKRKRGRMGGLRRGREIGWDIMICGWAGENGKETE